MTHSFDVEAAKKYGVNAAILFQYIHFCCENNKANNRHFHDGLTWTYNTRKAFVSLFPYLTEHKIRTAIDKLIEDGIIVKGKYNIQGYDQTTWYAVTEKGEKLLHKSPSNDEESADDTLKNGQCNIKKWPMEDEKMANGTLKNGQPIPVNIPVIKKNTKKDFEAEFEKFWEKYPNKFNRAQTYKNFVKTARRDGTDAVLRALDVYLTYIRARNIAPEYITRSTNFVGQKEVYKAYLEMDEAQTKAASKGSNDETELFKKLEQDGWDLSGYYPNGAEGY